MKISRNNVIEVCSLNLYWEYSQFFYDFDANVCHRISAQLKNNQNIFLLVLVEII